MTGHAKLIGVVSESTRPLTFNRLLLVEFGVVTRKNTKNYSAKAINYSFFDYIFMQD